MAHRKFIALFLAVFLVSTNVIAGFSSMRPPPGYSKNGQMPGWGPTYKPAPGEFYDLDKKQWMTVAKLNTGGRELSVPVALPVTSVGNVALAVATAFSSNPAILVGTAAWALYQAYLAQKRITAKPDGTFEQVQDGIDLRYEWQNNDNGLWYPSMRQAFDATARKPPFEPWDAVNFFGSPIDSNTASSFLRTYGSDGITVTGQHPSPDLSFIRRDKPDQSSSVKLIPPATVAAEMSQLPMDKPLVDALPYPLPVKSPVFNPDSQNKPQTLRVPQGSPSPIPLPSPNPNNIPQQWKTPVVDVVPSPTTDDPWRVETIPKDIIKTDPSSLPDPYNPTDPNAPPTVPVTQPDSGPGATEQPKQPGLCEEYPVILACAKPELDTPPTPELETHARELTFTPDQGWDSAGACPAPRHLPGANIDFQFTYFCNFMSGIKPILLTVASVIAGMIIIGARGGGAD
jgi:hypothetical protein